MALECKISLFVHISNFISIIKSQKKVNRVGSQEDRNKQPQQKSPKKTSAAIQQSAGAQKCSENKQEAVSSNYSGFRTTPEVEHFEMSDGKKRQKILPMPSHIGPKIRYWFDFLSFPFSRTCWLSGTDSFTWLDLNCCIVFNGTGNGIKVNRLPRLGRWRQYPAGRRERDPPRWRNPVKTRNR